MEYEAYEPDPEDEYYDLMCSAAYARMFNEGSGVYASTAESNQPAVSLPVAC